MINKGLDVLINYIIPARVFKYLFYVKESEPQLSIKIFPDHEINYLIQKVILDKGLEYISSLDEMKEILFLIFNKHVITDITKIIINDSQSYTENILTKK